MSPAACWEIGRVDSVCLVLTKRAGRKSVFVFALLGCLLFGGANLGGFRTLGNSKSAQNRSKSVQSSQSSLEPPKMLGMCLKKRCVGGDAMASGLHCLSEGHSELGKTASKQVERELPK